MNIASVVALSILGALLAAALILGLWSSMVRVYFREKRNHLREMLMGGNEREEIKDVRLER